LRWKPQRRRWWILAVLCLSVLLVVVDNTIVNIALPTISCDLSASTSALQWVVDGHTLAFAGLLLVGGNLGDRLGRRRLLQAGLVLFAVFSVGAAPSRSSGELIAARAARAPPRRSSTRPRSRRVGAVSPGRWRARVMSRCSAASGRRLGRLRSAY